MLPEYRKILYSTDLSKSSAMAFKQAVYLAKQTGAEIHILHVVEKLSNDAKVTFQTYVIDNRSRQELLDERIVFAKNKLAQYQNAFWERLDGEDLSVRKSIKSLKVIEAYPAETILKTSKDLDVDLIVMGTHEKGMLQTFLGSVAKSVLNRSTVPVLIVPLPVRED